MADADGFPAVSTPGRFPGLLPLAVSDKQENGVRLCCAQKLGLDCHSNFRQQEKVLGRWWRWSLAVIGLARVDNGGGGRRLKMAAGLQGSGAGNEVRVRVSGFCVLLVKMTAA